MKGDLHIHSRYSDGFSAINDVIKYANASGVQCLSVTDHDTIISHEQLKYIQQKTDIKLIPGVEMSAHDYKRDRKVHILCYLPVVPEKLMPLCEYVCENRKAAAKQMIKMVSEIYPVTESEIMSEFKECTSIYKPQIMFSLMKRGYTSKIFDDLFKQLFDPKSGTCYVSCKVPSVYETLNAVRESGGIAVFAHPPVYNSFELLEELCEQKLIDGIEVWHSRNNPGDAKRLTEIADKYSLIKTGGSDFHSIFSSRRVLIGQCVTPDDSIEKMYKLYNERK